MRIARVASIALIAVVAATMAATAAAGFEDEAGQIGRIMRLKHDISILNLLNGLHLTDEQQAAILEEARNAQALRESCRQRCSFRWSQTEDSFETLRSQLMDPGAPPPRGVESRARKENDDLKRMHESFMEELSVIEERVAAVLTDGQKQIIEEFKPCLIPPRNLRNPTRAGQANDFSRTERFLARSRSLPDDRYDGRCEVFLDRYISMVERKHGPMSDEDARAERARIRAVVDEARAMDDVEFELAKQEMAERIDPQGQFDRAPNRPLLSSGRRPGKISRFLLCEQSVKLLEERATHAGELAPITTTRLGSIIPAEDCKLRCGPK